LEAVGTALFKMNELRELYWLVIAWYDKALGSSMLDE
jgi:hypothetical protein